MGYSPQVQCHGWIGKGGKRDIGGADMPRPLCGLSVETTSGPLIMGEGLPSVTATTLCCQKRRIQVPGQGTQGPPLDGSFSESTGALTWWLARFLSVLLPVQPKGSPGNQLLRASAVLTPQQFLRSSDRCHERQVRVHSPYIPGTAVRGRPAWSRSFLLQICPLTPGPSPSRG